MPIVIHPKSQGSITLNSADPFDRPSIDPNVLGEEEDRKVMKAGKSNYCRHICSIRTVWTGIALS